MDECDEWDEDYYQSLPEDDLCPTCKGRGTVNELTAPHGFFCVGVTDCPSCDGTGSSYG